MMDRRRIAVIVLLVAFAWIVWRILPSGGVGDSIRVYYTKTDGTTVEPWKVSLGAARDLPSVAYYAAIQAVAGPPSTTAAIRFPAGTIVRKLHVSKQIATADLSIPEASPATGDGGSLAENAEFKSFVWTITDLPGVRSVRILINGHRVDTLPGGHLDLSQPLSRADW